MRKHALAAAALLLFIVPVARAGVTNPDISVIGQPVIRWTDDPNSLARRRPVFDVGETEFVFDAALNPYARGFFAVSMADGDVGVEEGYFTLLRGLPGDITLKGGKYRAGFGKLNAAHPHTYPFADRFGVLAAYLPGEESFNETGLSVGWRVPLPGSWSVTANADVLQGDSFRIERTPGANPGDPLVADPVEGDHASEPRAAVLGRLEVFLPVDDRSGLELGASATQGTNNVAAGTRTRVLGGDIKGKLWTGPNSYMHVQGEFLHSTREQAQWFGQYSKVIATASGFYLFGDYNWAQRYNAGASFEAYDSPVNLIPGQPDGRALGVFAGLALMEETTAFRLDYRRRFHDVGTSNELSLRVIFSMGPHKAHQF